MSGPDEGANDDIAPSQHEIALEAGAILFSEGDVGDRAYVVRTGRMEVSRRVGSAHVVLAVEGPGTILGEMALIDDQPRSATIRALEPSSLTVVPREAFDFHLARTDPVIRMLLERFTTIIRSISAENVRLILGIR
ncbi:cyclic nucleotide-binding domain-containing protein [Roseospira marina]|uniref:Cyclic nucleotide-binding domain-containing protein n=1 Tax=Roseospira marina TaxID=140057 RepID=A0A5M6IAT3_9PROT|nr:cyclic nucleotide-binding domain-containing protein [Roseospira marina]KAA5605222.1 cyclic nucleotide-binding domain-containing protein [Roseospira marina]MBB4314677.1 CRP-like cAMP-binding protein [Roseospira marina]MBB5087666.1 CRP-like cAMP-binding protein [Roseospira marina]